MTRSPVALPALAGLALVAITLILLFLVPVSVRHAAPFGSVQTVDFDRSIAVPGGEIQASYGNFDRVGLDIRAYGNGVPGDLYDFVLTLQSLDRPEIVRRVAFSVPAERVPATRTAFSDTYTSIGFEPVPNSVGERFYLSLERGPRNADDVVTLWGIQSFSTVMGIDVLSAAIDDYRIGFSAEQDTAIMLLLMGLTLAGAGALTAAVIGAALAGRPRRDIGSVQSYDRS